MVVRIMLNEQAYPHERRTMMSTQNGGRQYSRNTTEENWLDKQARGYSDVMVWLHLVLCQCPGIIVGLLFVTGCTTPEGKEKGTKLLIYSAIGIAV